MVAPSIVVTDTVDTAAAHVIAAGLDSFNKAAAGYEDYRALAVIVRDPKTDEVLGGATGRTSLGLLFLDLFYLPEHMRGSGLGSAVLKAFEDEGRARSLLHCALVAQQSRLEF